MSLALALAVSGFVVVNVAMTHYFMTIAKERVPEDVRPHSALLILGAAMGLVAIGLSPDAVTISLGGLSTGFAAFILWLLGQRRTPDGTLTARIGEPMPDVVAPDQDGNRFELAALEGQRVLFKFFRGFW